MVSFFHFELKLTRYDRFLVFSKFSLLEARSSKVTFQRQHFPWEFRAGSYIFGIRRARRMGAASQLNEIPTFYILPPPPTTHYIIYHGITAKRNKPHVVKAFEDYLPRPRFKNIPTSIQRFCYPLLL